MVIKKVIEKSAFSISLLALLATGCTQAQLDRLEYVGKEPPMMKVESPIKRVNHRNISWPTPPPLKMQPIPTANSLWLPGAKTFFRDQRARNIGDIVMVKVEIKDKANLDNKTERKREHTDNLNAGALFGLENKALSLLSDQADANKLLEVGSDAESKGEGIIEREEEIETEIAAVVIQILSTGHFVIEGSQEIRVNHEVRQLTVSGVVQPDDISADNVINLTQMAEARVSYGGKGIITDVQQPRVGNQIVDILSPW